MTTLLTPGTVVRVKIETSDGAKKTLFLEVKRHSNRWLYGREIIGKGEYIGSYAGHYNDKDEHVTPMHLIDTGAITSIQVGEFATDKRYGETRWQQK